MRDPRIAALARILVRYSIAARKGWSVGVTAGTEAEPLVLVVYEELVRAGAFPILQMQPAAAAEILLKQGQPHHFATLTPYQRAYARCVDARVIVGAETNTRALSAVDPRRQSQLSRTLRPVAELLLTKPWVYTLFPTNAFAQDAEMSLSDFEDFVYGACFADEPDPLKAWKALHAYQARLAARLRGADRVHIVGPETDLRFSIRRRTFINSDGVHNMPSGEIFTAPVEDSVEGHIAYDYPVCHAGREVDGIRLVFRAGRVVEASARKNEPYLKAMLETDPGARRLGEFGIGTNRKIQRFTRSILFDEKIGGTIHLALGRSYPETGGRNRSAIHWDMIKDLRRGGTIRVDGRLFERNGRFV